MTTKRKVAILVAILLGAIAFLIAMQFTTHTTVEKADARGTGHRIHVLRRAHRAFMNGHPKRAKRIIRQGGIRHDPRHREVQSCGGSKSPIGCKTLLSHGTSTARWDVLIEQDGVNFDVLRSRFAQTWHWRHGRVRDVSDLHVHQHVTQWGSIVGWDKGGVSGHENQFLRHRHVHVSGKTSHYNGGAPLFGGIIHLTDKDITGIMRLTGRGGQFFHAE